MKRSGRGPRRRYARQDDESCRPRGVHCASKAPAAFSISQRSAPLAEIPQSSRSTYCRQAHISAPASWPPQAGIRSTEANSLDVSNRISASLSYRKAMHERLVRHGRAFWRWHRERNELHDHLDRTQGLYTLMQSPLYGHQNESVFEKVASMRGERISLSEKENST